MLELELRDGILQVFRRYKNVHIVGHPRPSVERDGVTADDRMWNS